MEQLLRSSDPESLFQPIKSDAFLPEDYEDVQTYSKFVDSRTRYKVTQRRHTLHVYRIGKMSARYQRLSTRLVQFLRAFFVLPVVEKGELVTEPHKKSRKDEYIVRPTDSKDGYYVKSQTKKRSRKTNLKAEGKNGKDVIELDAGDILGVLIHYIESDTYTIVGITSHNIYNPKYKDDIIMGLGCGSRSCVISIPECFDATIKDQTKADKNALFEMIKTASHEISHTMGIDHCVEYNCIMNSLYVKESDTKPLYFCPVCAYKLQTAVGFECEDRWKKLKKYYTMTGLLGAAKWVDKRLKQWAIDTNK